MILENYRKDLSILKIVKNYLDESKNLKGFTSKYQKYLKQENFEIGEDPYDISHTIHKM